MLNDNRLGKFFRQFKMANRPYTILIKYTLLQIPALVLIISILMLLKQWVAIPSYVVWGIVILWVIKDVILFPLTWRSYGSDRQHDPHPMVGRYGIAQQSLAPSGYVKIDGVLWRAEVIGDDSAINAGESIRVQKVNGLTLYVVRHALNLRDQRNRVGR
jgi:membrane protein implicated in regulation of membrane protease activity